MRSGAGAVRLGVGSRLAWDGAAVEVVEMVTTAAGNEVVLKDGVGRVLRVAVRELLFSDRAQVVADGPGPSSGDDQELAGVVLSGLDAGGRREVVEQAAHVREIQTGYRSGSSLLAAPGEPRPGFEAGLPKMDRYRAKAAELGVSLRTVTRWVAAVEAAGEAGLAPAGLAASVLERCDPRWVETATEVMVEHVDASRPSRRLVIERARARAIARFGAGAVRIPGRTMAYAAIEELERRHPLFRLSTKRNRDIAARPEGVFGRLRPTRPGEYLLMDTTRLDVFAMDPVTLRWANCELTVAMDWYTRCVVGLRLTPVSTKSVDAAAVLFQAFRPRPVRSGWAAQAVWPEHGVPRAVLLDPGAIDGPIAAAAGPALVPETVVVDHGKVFVSAHLTSVCARMGISIQPARLRTGRDKGPIERFFRTLREDVLQVLPGYKGPDLHSRGSAPEDEAFYYLDELESKIGEWVAATYHRRPHSCLVDPGVPGLRMSPAQMFAHGMARAGFIEVPRDPYLGLEFLPTVWRTVQPYGVEIAGRRYSGAGLPPPGSKSPYPKGLWPIQIDPDDVSRAWFRDLQRCWHPLAWEHAASLDMPLSAEALAFARKLAADKYRFADDRLAVAELAERWNLGLGTSSAERRMALRMSRAGQDPAFGGPPAAISLLPSVRHALTADEPDAGQLVLAGELVGDDDAFDEKGDFYADALDDVED